MFIILCDLNEFVQISNYFNWETTEIKMSGYENLPTSELELELQSVRRSIITSKNTISGFKNQMNEKNWEKDTLDYFKGVINFNENCLKKEQQKESEILSILRERDTK